MSNSNITKALEHRKMAYTIIISTMVGVIYIAGCASNNGVTKTSSLKPSPTLSKNTPAPQTTSPPVEVVSKPNMNENDTNQNTLLKTQGIPKVGSSYFAFDQYNLTKEDTDTLAKNAQWLKRNPKIHVRVEGNCDERGTVEYNLALGERRANAVKNYYESFGISANRIQTISYGKERPKYFGHNEDAWAKNRRADTNKILSN